MSTNAMVFTQKEDKIIGIYNHWDGYPEGLGVVLEENYTDYESVLDLISQGEASYISSTIEDSRFYHTWRGEELTIYESNSIEEFLDEYSMQYNYFFDSDQNQWVIYDKKDIAC